jgi:hypothetical protein
MKFAQTAVHAAVLLLAPVPLVSAAAQPAAPASPAPPVAPPAWTVSSDDARGAVKIAATARDGMVHFVGGCSKSSPEPGLVGAFSGYQGNGLRTDGEIEHVAFYARGGDWQEAFSVRLRYSTDSRSWEFARPLAPVFLSSFSRAATLAVVNSQNQEIFSFDLTGSTAAVRAMRTICGLE